MYDQFGKQGANGMPQGFPGGGAGGMPAGFSFGGMPGGGMPGGIPGGFSFQTSGFPRGHNSSYSNQQAHENFARMFGSDDPFASLFANMAGGAGGGFGANQ